MKAFATRTTIRATPEAVWAILTDAPSYASWNTTVDRVDGDVALGNKLTVHAKLSPGRAFPVKVVELSAPRRMVWFSGLPLGLFEGERVFELAPGAGGDVEFSMREAFTGLLAPMITRSIPDLQPAFDEFAACLKTRAERG
jgi:hypothetical protein